MKEQIKEIAKVLCEKYDTEHCKVCDHYGRCMVRLDAEWIYEAGYRKQSEPISCGHEKGVEVVRCKDCRHCKFNSSAEVYKCDRRGYFTETVEEDGFCSYGERKETHDNI